MCSTCLDSEHNLMLKERLELIGMNATDNKGNAKVTFYYDTRDGSYSEGLRVVINGQMVLNNKPSMYKGYALEECVLNLLYALGYDVDEVKNVELDEVN